MKLIFKAPIGLVLLFQPVLQILVLANCSTLERSPMSGYQNYQEKPSQIEDTPASWLSDSFRSVAPTKEESLMRPEDHLMIAQRQKLRKLESSLNTSKEKEQYARVLSLLQSDSEKIAFLQIPTPEERQVWIQKQGLWGRSQTNQNSMKALIENQDIAIGMPQDLVRKSWGEPMGIEVSGNPLYKNERWKYLRSVTLADGFKQEKRYVYFEGGRVVGWETE